MKFDPEFKKAISQLSPAEKDKLILRLLKKDLALANQLEFELVSDDTVQDRRDRMFVRVEREVDQITQRHYSPGYLLTYLRSLSGEINVHVKTTRDKQGEVSLNLQMLNLLLQKNNERLLQAKPNEIRPLGIYIIGRAFKILTLVKALHEDFFVEFEEGLLTLGKLITSNRSLMKIAVSNGFDVDWLINSSIPDNIGAIHKDVRAKGLLK